MPPLQRSAWLLGAELQAVFTDHNVKAEAVYERFIDIDVYPGDAAKQQLICEGATAASLRDEEEDHAIDDVIEDDLVYGHGVVAPSLGVEAQCHMEMEWSLSSGVRHKSWSGDLICRYPIPQSL